jgi:hypothetical protein
MNRFDDEYVLHRGEWATRRPEKISCRWPRLPFTAWCCAALAALTALSGCGGGGSNWKGGDFTAAPPAYPTITSNAAVPSQSFPARLDQPGTLTSRSATVIGSSTWTAAGLPQSVRLDITIRDALTPGAALSFTETFSSFTPYADPGTGAAFSTAEKTGGDGSIRRVRLMTPSSLGLHYSTLGAWEYEPSAGAAQSFAAQFAIGPATRGVDLPTSGSANYSGAMIGNYADGAAIVPVSAFASASADFGARVLRVGTTGTFLSGPDVHRPDLDIDPATSTLTWAKSTNVLSGTLRTGGNLSGSASGRFYGPAAAELGGGFFLRDSASGEQMSGAFVMKKTP